MRRQGSREEPLVVAQVAVAQAVGAGRVEDGDTAVERRVDGRDGPVFGTIGLRRKPHAAEADPRLAVSDEGGGHRRRGPGGRGGGDVEAGWRSAAPRWPPSTEGRIPRGPGAASGSRSFHISSE